MAFCELRERGGEHNAAHLKGVRVGRDRLHYAKGRPEGTRGQEEREKENRDSGAGGRGDREKEREGEEEGRNWAKRWLCRGLDTPWLRINAPCLPDFPFRSVTSPPPPPPLPATIPPSALLVIRDVPRITNYNRAPANLIGTPGLRETNPLFPDRVA